MVLRVVHPPWRATVAGVTSGEHPFAYQLGHLPTGYTCSLSFVPSRLSTRCDGGRTRNTKAKKDTGMWGNGYRGFTYMHWFLVVLVAAAAILLCGCTRSASVGTSRRGGGNNERRRPQSVKN